MRGLPRFLFAAALITLLVVPMAASGQQGTDRPFTARLKGSSTWWGPGLSPSNCTIATMLTDSTGQATHMGRVQASWSLCPLEPAYVLDGWLTITASNGDKLVGRFDYDPTSPIYAFSVQWTGGTGRFAKASGSVVVTYEGVPQFIPGCDPVPDPTACFDFSVPWPWFGTITGTITY